MVVITVKHAWVILKHSEIGSIRCLWMHTVFLKYSAMPCGYGHLERTNKAARVELFRQSIKVISPKNAVLIRSIVSIQGYKRSKPNPAKSIVSIAAPPGFPLIQQPSAAILIKSEPGE